MPDDTRSQDNTSQDEKQRDPSSQSPGPELGLVGLARQDSAAQDFLKQITEDTAPVVETGGELAEKGLLDTYLGIFISLVSISSDTPCQQDGMLWFNAINPTTGKKYESNDECMEVHARQAIAEYQRYQLQLAAEASGYFSDGSVDSCTQTCKMPAPLPAPTFTPAPEPEPETGTIVLTCDPDWDDCQKNQAREKIRRLNELAKQRGGLKRRPTSGRIRQAGNAWAAKFRSDSYRLCKGEAPSKLRFTARRDWLWKGDPARADAPFGEPTGTKDDFMDHCLYQQWLKSNCDPLDNASPDHVQDLQWGGHVQGPFAWLDRDVNEKLGRDMNAGPNADVDVATEFELVCP